MGYISGSGIRFAALTLALAISCTPNTLNANQASSLDVAVTGLRNAKGNVLICLTANPKHFPDCGKDPNSRKLQVSAAKAGAVHFDGVAPGTYALALIHDENSNNKMDLAIFMPKEGFGFSRNPAIVMGPPKFKSAQFAVGAGDVKLPVKMKYMF